MQKPLMIFKADKNKYGAYFNMHQYFLAIKTL
jgi:hypothetical protein